MTEGIYQRSEIIDKVKAGALLPDQAEQEAARLGLGPLAEDPDPAAFNPWRVERWPLPMVLAWIGWRDTESVRAAWPEYQAARFVWRPMGEGWDLMHGEARTILGMIAQQEHDFDAGLMQDTILHAWEDLKAHLARGQISAIGRRKFNPSNAPPAIDPSEWPYVEISLDFTSDAGALLPFTNVLFKSEEIRAFWPASTDQASPKPLRKDRSFSSADNPLVEKMRPLVQAGLSPSAAALHFVNEAKGGGDTVSKQRRLQRAYSKVYGVA